jgi:hypothetical protein
MGGAFVAVASDSSAVWWNAAGLAAGPFFDMALTQARVWKGEDLPAWRQRVSGVSVAVPPLGVSYYRFRITDIRPFDPTTAGESVDREDRRAGVPVRSFSASQLGVTVVQTLIPDVHVGATVKYMRGAPHAGREDSLAAAGDLLDIGDALETAAASGVLDVDVGVLAFAGPVRIGGRFGNVLEPELGDHRLERRARVGLAYDPERIGGVPLTVAVDADVSEYEGPIGARRIVAVGAERWFVSRRVGLRGGARVNTTGAEERTAAGGVTVAVRAGIFVEGHMSAGSAHESGWSVSARVSF